MNTVVVGLFCNTFVVLPSTFSAVDHVVPSVDVTEQSVFESPPKNTQSLSLNTVLPAELDVVAIEVELDHALPS